MPAIGGSAESTLDLSEDGEVAVGAGRRDELARRAGVRGILRRRGRVEPVTELEPLAPGAVLVEDARDRARVGTHEIGVTGEACEVAVVLEEGPGDPDRGIAPDRRWQRGAE